MFGIRATNLSTDMERLSLMIEAVASVWRASIVIVSLGFLRYDDTDGKGVGNRPDA